MALPHGGQAQLPGVLWPNPSVWTLAAACPGRGPAIAIRQLNRKQANVLPAHGTTSAQRRARSPTPRSASTARRAGRGGDRRQHGQRQRRASAGLDRINTIELTRICRSPAPVAKGVLRAMLRLWRDFLAVPYWTFRPHIEKRALVTYSLPGKKAGSCTASTAGSHARLPPMARQRHLAARLTGRDPGSTVGLLAPGRTGARAPRARDDEAQPC